MAREQGLSLDRIDVARCLAKVIPNRKKGVLTARRDEPSAPRNTRRAGHVVAWVSIASTRRYLRHCRLPLCCQGHCPPLRRRSRLRICGFFITSLPTLTRRFRLGRVASGKMLLQFRMR